MLDSDKPISPVGNSDQLIEFRLDGGTVSVLRVLNEENHQKSDDCGRCVDEKLPSLGKTHRGPGNEPQSNETTASREGQRLSSRSGDGICRGRKHSFHVLKAPVGPFITERMARKFPVER
jgi:hypothetical protein